MKVVLIVVDISEKSAVAGFSRFASTVCWHATQAAPLLGPSLLHAARLDNSNAAAAVTTQSRFVVTGPSQGVRLEKSDCNSEERTHEGDTAEYQEQRAHVALGAEQEADDQQSEFNAHAGHSLLHRMGQPWDRRTDAETFRQVASHAAVTRSSRWCPALHGAVSRGVGGGRRGTSYGNNASPRRAGRCSCPICPLPQRVASVYATCGETGRQMSVVHGWRSFSGTLS